MINSTFVGSEGAELSSPFFFVPCTTTTSKLLLHQQIHDFVVIARGNVNQKRASPCSRASPSCGSWCSEPWPPIRARESNHRILGRRRAGGFWGPNQLARVLPVTGRKRTIFYVRVFGRRPSAVRSGGVMAGGHWWPSYSPAAKSGLAGREQVGCPAAT